MSKKHYNRNDSGDQSTEAKSGTKTKQPSNVTLDDLQVEGAKKQVGPSTPKVERQSFALALCEFLLIFAIFFMYGAWPVPDTNEPYYVGKAMHAWHPESFQNDVFFNSHDTHWLFYKSFGWLTLYMGLDAATWVGRVVLWAALAFGWYRLNRVVIGRPWASVISAMIFACFMVKFQMAGEWVIGGVEGKVFAYVFVFLGLDALARNRWNLMWVMFGMAAAYHPVVGAWSVIAGGIAWLLQRRSDRMPLKRMIIPLLIGGAISLIGVAPIVMMNRPSKKESETAQQASTASPEDAGQSPMAQHVAQRPITQHNTTTQHDALIQYGTTIEMPQLGTSQPNPPQPAGMSQFNTGIPAFENVPPPVVMSSNIPPNNAYESPGNVSATAESAETIEARETVDAKSELKKIREKAAYIAVFKRLSHHQLPYKFPTSWVIRLSLLTMAWLFCAAIVWGRKTIRPEDPQAIPDDEPIVQPPAPPGFRIACFIVGTIMISCAGFIIAYGLRVPIPDENNIPEKVVLAAKLLQLYWFRMTDFSIPLGMGLCGTAILYRVIERCRREKYPTEPQWWVKTLGVSGLMIGVVYGLAFLYFARFCPPIKRGSSYELLSLESQTLAYGVVLVLASFLLFLWRNSEPQPNRLPTRPLTMLFLSLLIVFGASVPMLLDRTERRLNPNYPRTVLYPSINNYHAWRDMCDWIAKNTPEEAVFLVPQRDESFKWYAKRANVSTRKEMPQDAVSLVKWYETMTDCYSLNLPEEERQKISERSASYLSLTIKTKTRDELIVLQKKYGFSYIVSEERPELDLPILHRTDFYILYQADAETLGNLR